MWISIKISSYSSSRHFLLHRSPMKLCGPADRRIPGFFLHLLVYSIILHQEDFSVGILGEQRAVIRYHTGYAVCIGSPERYLDHKTAPHTALSEINLPAHELRQFSAYGKTKACSAVFSGSISLALFKRPEDTSPILFAIPIPVSATAIVSQNSLSSFSWIH